LLLQITIVVLRLFKLYNYSTGLSIAVLHRKCMYCTKTISHTRSSEIVIGKICKGYGALPNRTQVLIGRSGLFQIPSHLFKISILILSVFTKNSSSLDSGSIAKYLQMFVLNLLKHFPINFENSVKLTQDLMKSIHFFSK